MSSFGIVLNLIYLVIFEKNQPMQSNIILTNEQVNQKLLRISFQIIETMNDDEELILAGISKNGYLLAEKIGKNIKKNSDLKFTLCEVFINKNKPLHPISTSIDESEYSNKNLVLIDDVLHTGTTLIYAVKHFLNVPVNKFKTVVLVDRNHKKYPIKADFKGISLSTSLKEHVRVEFNNDNCIATLT
jgi:pyrimidine operon attenuation protein/uracil phosphoribosyltransferase